MQNSNSPSQPDSAPVNDLSALRLPANYGGTLGVKKLLTTVPVTKPKKSSFFRSHTNEAMRFPAMLLENKEANESYLVMPYVAQSISELVRPMVLHAVIDRQNNVSLVPVPLPDSSGKRNPWHESLAQAVEHAKSKWIRISANMHLGNYEVYEAEGALPDPDWPSCTMDELVRIAFRGKIIDSLEHPAVQSLLGRI